MKHLPSLTALRCFDASARLQSFTKAAAEVHLTQGAVSQQVIGLETLLGVALFDRRRTGLTLTAAGRTYWTDTSVSLRQIERATQNMVMHKGQGGALNLCCASSFSSHWLMPRLNEFVTRHPEVTLNLSTHIGPVDFSASAHDAAIEYCDGPGPGLSAEKVLALTLHPYASPELLRSMSIRKRRDTIDADDLVKLLSAKPLIRHTTVPNAWAAWLCQAGLQGQVQDDRHTLGPQYDLLSMALHGAIGGLGVALLPDYMTSSPVETGQLVRLSEAGWEAPKSYYLRYPHWKADLPVVKLFSAWLLNLATGQRQNPPIA
jgi:LysR family glycine cleavage system transcriptional activator